MAADTVGERIRRYRRLRKWTQEQLAEAAGTTKAYIGKIEAGVIGEPGLDVQRRIARALGIELRQIADPGWYEGIEETPDGQDWMVRMRGDPALTDEEKQIIEGIAVRFRDR